MFDYSNFIAPYSSTSKVIRFLNPDSTTAFTISVCNYQKSLVNKSDLIITLENNLKEYILPFSSHTNALNALAIFRETINELIVNCPEYNYAFSSVDVNALKLKNRPWIKQGNTIATNNDSVLNTDNIFHLGNVAIGKNTANNLLDISTGVAGSSGIRLTDITSTISPLTNTTKCLTVDNNGDVIYSNISNVKSYFSFNTFLSTGANTITHNLALSNGKKIIVQVVDNTGQIIDATLTDFTNNSVVISVGNSVNADIKILAIP